MTEDSSKIGADQETERHLLRSVVENAVDGIITIDRFGTILSANPAVEKIFGYPPSELHGQNVRMLMPSPYHDEHDGYLENYRTTGVRKIIGIGREVHGRKKDGSVFPLDLAVSQTDTANGPIFTGIVRDITERQAAEEAIRRERALLKAVVDTAVDGILTIDSIGTILTANPAVERIFGYRPEDIVGKNVRMLMPTPYHEQHDGYLANYRNTGERKIIGIGREVHGLRKDGSIFPLDLAVSETPTEQGVIFTGILRDITDRVRTIELQLAKEAADKANQAKSEFLSRMSHELRTPLNAVIGFAQILEMRYDDPKIMRATQSILKAGQHLLSLINEVLDLARIESGNLALSLETVALRDVMDQAIELIRPIAARADVSVLLTAEMCASTYVVADRQRLLQVFINLLSNAVKFNRPGGVIRMTCVSDGEDFCRIRIEDTGFGITAAQRSLLFQPFERFCDSHIEGTGLGLVLSRRFVDLMGGSLELESSSSQGSTFCLELRKAPIDSRTVLQAPRLIDRSISGAGIVLYIEDNLSNVKLVEMLMEDWPAITLIPAMQGQVGLELAKSHRPNLVLLDLHLPDISGVEVLARLKSDPTTMDIPVVVITADAVHTGKQAVLDAGASGHMTKPIVISDFISMLETFLPRGESE